MQTWNKKLERNYLSVFRLLSRQTDVTFLEQATIVAFKTGCQTDWLNGVLVSRIEDRDISRVVTEIIDEFRQAELKGLWRINNLSCNQMSLKRELAKVGASASVIEPGMTISLKELAPIPPTPLRIETVRGMRMLDDWLGPFSASFELPEGDRAFFRSFLLPIVADVNHPFELVVAYENSLPVSSGSVFLADGIAGIYNISTSPSCRKLGYGTAITRQCLEVAKNKGAVAAGLYASGGKNMYRTLGFEQICEMEFFPLGV